MGFCLQVIWGGRVEKEFELKTDGYFVVGRGEDADLMVRDNRLSRAHFGISVNGGRIEVEDLGSTNGTLVDGHRLKGENDPLRSPATTGTVTLAISQPLKSPLPGRSKAPIRDGSIIEAGNTRFELKSTAAPGKIDPHARMKRSGV